MAVNVAVMKVGPALVIKDLAMEVTANKEGFEENWQVELYYFAQKYYRLINGHDLSNRQLFRLRRQLDLIKNKKIEPNSRVGWLDEWLKSELHD
jgi:hypothetical protein